MRKLFLLAFLPLLGLLAPSPAIVAKAADTSLPPPGGEVELPAVGLVGDFTDPRTGNDQDWNTGDPVPFEEKVEDEDGTWWALEIHLDEGNEFKAYAPSGGVWIGPGQDGGLDPESFSYSAWDGNWSVLKSGSYRILVNEEAATAFGADSSGVWKGGEEVEIELGKIVYHNGDEVIGEDEGPLGSAKQTRWIFQEGMVLDGWFFDPELTIPVSMAITLDGTIDVYGKYSPAGPDIRIEHLGEYTHYHYWNSASGASSVWPGSEMTFEEDLLGGHHVAVIPGEYDPTGILFHDNQGNQTPDMNIDEALVGEDGAYPLFATDSGWLPEDSSLARREALAFLDAWEKDIVKDGDVCWLKDEKESWDALRASYEGLSANARNLVDSYVTVGETTIGDTMGYLSLLIDGALPGEGLSPYAGIDPLALGLGIGAGALVLLGAAVILVRARKKGRKEAE